MIGRPLLAVLCVAALVHAAPRVVGPQDVGRHVGETISTEGNVVRATTSGDTCVLELGMEGNATLRAILLIPVISDLPRAPDQLYQGKRVRVTGRVRRFQSRIEVVLTGPGQIEVIDVATGMPVVPQRDTPPAPPPSDPASSTPPPRGLVAAVAPTLALDPCPQAKARWEDAAHTAMAKTDDLRRCLAESRHRCRPFAAALAPALSNLEWREQQLDDACP